MLQKLSLLFLLTTCQFCWAYFADWSLLTRDRNPVCVPIPSNMTLCHNIGYNKMRLPNLLEHDSMQEVSQQAASWVPLLNVKCHDDSQLFLCSLFAPVCLERPIYPCRSLCLKVKQGCLVTMESYGFPWPSMLDCDKFPLDNDMCITPQSEDKPTTAGKARSKERGKEKAEENAEKKEGASSAEEGQSECSDKPCNQPETYENILDSFCRADFVVKMKLRNVEDGETIYGRKVNTVYKTWRGTPEELRRLRKPVLKLQQNGGCCGTWLGNQSPKTRYLVMGRKMGNDLVPTFILPWRRSKEMKRARRMFKQIDCSDVKETSLRVVAESFASHTLFSEDAEARGQSRTKRLRKGGSGRRRRKGGARSGRGGREDGKTKKENGRKWRKRGSTDRAPADEHASW